MSDFFLRAPNMGGDKKTQIRKLECGMRKTGNGAGLNLLPYTVYLFSGVGAAVYPRPQGL
jgi:hypothetical protein